MTDTNFNTTCCIVGAGPAGVGINYAIQDAIVTAGIVGPPLLKDSLNETHLAAVQKKRKWPTRIVQCFQHMMQKRIVKAALNGNSQFKTPWLLRIPFARRMLARFIAFGLLKVKLPAQNKPTSDDDIITSSSPAG